VVAIVVALALVGVAVFAASGGGKSKANSPTGKSSPSSPPNVLAPTGLASKVDFLSVQLTRTEPAGGAAVTGFNIYRDGLPIGDVDATTTTYTDTTVQPGNDYTYHVEAVSGDVASSRADLPVHVEFPSKTLARVQGIWSVTAKTLFSSGFTKYPKSFTLGWSFKPKCKTGPCAIAWKDLSTKSFSATLKRTKGSYKGSDSGDFNGRCGSTHTTTTLTITFKVTEAAVIEGKWLATTVKGTIKQVDPAQSGCVEGHATISVTGVQTST
jgi:hypothetical protein